MLDGYAGALTETVRALVDRQQILADGSRGGRDNPMTWGAFQERERRYEASITQYKLIGAKLNDVAAVIFD